MREIERELRDGDKKIKIRNRLGRPTDIDREMIDKEREPGRKVG